MVLRRLFYLMSAIPKAILRKRCPVIFSDLSRNKPVSKVFGVDRGDPIDRYYINQFLERESESISGAVLEIGDSWYSNRFGGDRVISREVLHFAPGNPDATIIGDLTEASTLPENKVDCFICTQTFHVIFDIRKAIEGAWHVLKPGGVLLATVPGISQISREDMDRWGDYWRFTGASALRLFEAVFAEVKVETYGNVLAAVAFLQGIAVEDLPDVRLLDHNDPDYPVVITIRAVKGKKKV